MSKEFKPLGRGFFVVFEYHNEDFECRDAFIGTDELIRSMSEKTTPRLTEIREENSLEYDYAMMLYRYGELLDKVAYNNVIKYRNV